MAGYLGQKPAVNGIYTVDELTSSGGNTYTLSRAPGSKNNIQVSAGGLVQYPSAYSVSGTTLTLSGVPSGQKVIIRHMGETILYPNLDDNIVTSAKINANAVTAAKLATSGTMPAWNGSALTGLPASGDKRNFIIDGDFTQWPEGDKTSIAHGAYGPALWRHWSNGPTAVKDIKQSTDVPTVAQSGHQSKYSVHIDVTTADAAVGASEALRFGYHITGSDFAYLHQQQVTLAFWVKDTKTGPHAVSFANSAVDRSYVAEYTINTTNTWEYKTITLTLDTSGTWLFTEADIGLFIFFGLLVGSTYHGTANTWGARAYGTSSTVNSMDSTSNNFHLSQVGLYLGSTAPTFVGESVATVREQVDYYVQRYEYANEGNEMICSGFQNSTTVAHCQLNYRNYLRTAAPTITHAPAAGFAVSVSGGISPATSFTDNNKGRHGCRFSVTHGSQGAAKDPCSWARDGSDTCWIVIDSRH